MVVHDKATTICCSRCSEEYTVDGFLYAERTMRRKAAKMGWKVVDDQDVCPRCVQQEKIKCLLPNGHFTASQLLLFKEAVKNARATGKTKLTCPICNENVALTERSGIDSYIAVCSGCGVSFRKE